MNYMNIAKAGGSAIVMKTVVDRILTLKDRRRLTQRRTRTRNLLIWATIGTVTGAAAGLLLAPQSGRKTREMISTRTGHAIDEIKSRASEAGDMLNEQVRGRAARVRTAAETCASSVMEAVGEIDEDADKAGKRKGKKK